MTTRVWYGALGIALPLCLPAQTPAPIALLPGTSGPVFNEIRAVRELQDGRVLVIDWKDRTVMVADWNSAEPRPVGRTGDGPGEYRAPGVLIPLKGDSTLVIDLQKESGSSFIGIASPQR